MKKIAVFGGSFDPVHLGHSMLVEACDEVFHFDRIHVVPTGNAPHKKAFRASDDQRFEMLRRAFDGAIIERWELQKEKTCYTYDLLMHYRAALSPDESLFFLLGEDALHDIPKWYRFPELLWLSEWVAVGRNGTTDSERKLSELLSALQSAGLKWKAQEEEHFTRFALNDDQENNTSLYILKKKIADISSTEVKRRLREEGLAAAAQSGMLADPVVRYLKTVNPYDNN